ncbi:hypothetical protein BD410DRAFT_272559 [Rickenella mellea]|uniref:P-loop containing nucleoside triphosphate hydrolase protein n=1 Tax=Rickenella mellea TaxID=50990 RepID=A0A4Y7Q4C4_9AGAM|nr:hypothetical protein BD410DRAFT_272559 [Rickenella mellea]
MPITENSNLQNEKTRLRNHIRSLQESISKTEKELEGLQNLDTELLHHNTRMEDKQNRLEMIKNDTKSSDYDGKVNQLIVKKKGLEAQRETLDTELRTINRQADDRAKLGFKRDEHKSKSQEIANIVSIHNAKFRQLVGSEIKPDSMLRDLDRSISDKDGERDEAENEYSTLNSTYQLADSTLASSKADLKKKQEELKAAERKLQGALLDHKSVKAAVSEATTELNLRTTEGGSMAGANEIYASLLKTGKAKKTCTACNRPLGDHEMDSFENHLTALINKNTPEKIAENLQEAVEWQEELKRLQTLLPIENTRDLLKSKEIPRIESLIKEQEEKLPNINATVEKALEKVTHLKKELKEMSLLRQQSLSMSRLQVDTGRIQQEISDIEERLTASGSVKDIKDVQEDIDKIAESIRVCERDINTVAAERDRQLGLARTYESELLKMQLDTSNLQSRLRDKSALETRVKTDLEGVSKANQELKDAESKVSKAQAPLNDLTRQHSESQRQYDERIEKLQKRVEELTRKEDTLKTSSKEIYDYVRNKYSRALEECNERLDNLASEIKDVERDIDDMRSSKSELEKEMNDGGASVVKLYQNRRIRKLRLDIAKIQEEIDSIDMEEASKARRNFDTKFKIEKERETHLGGECGRLSGELSSLKAQVKTVEGDLKEFKDITKRYTEQLVKVKMSDMANNDLEKYSKALDNAIMKYHSLKMEEVNDIMRHLWNKTYQGTDIDGIKIRSDVEGGASKRSYNYRVVMTKDQVEMDMRGRCSAGQKMLASIIIRLALSDSFGQNCGILALDEPTNALDTDNIDALAASLVDIINERKNYSNFQLIIITHDENFLSKLGQADVMEHYWRVSRDERQKSVIQRQRFG